VREAKNSGEEVEARLRAVLRPAPAAPPAEDGPLSWSDIIPGWAEEDLPEADPPFRLSPAAGGPPSGGGAGAGSRHYPSARSRHYDLTPPVAGSPDRVAPGPAPAFSGPSRRDPGGGAPGVAVPSPVSGFPWDGPMSRPVAAPDGLWEEPIRRTVPEPTAPEPTGPDGLWEEPIRRTVSEPAGPDLASYVWEDLRGVSSPPEPDRHGSGDAGPDEEPQGVRLTGAGAFGGERRAWAQAFDPGRPGVRALAAVAVVVVLVAAFLAWRARPRVDEIGTNDPQAVVSEPAGGVGGRPAGGAGRPAGDGSGGDGPRGVLPSGGGAAEVVVAVGGKVRKPGLVHLPPGARVADAITAAGGAQPGVDVDGLNLARKVTDGELIMVGASPPPGTVTVPGASPPAAAGGLVNLNTAGLSDLDGLPGVGPVLAQRILDARTQMGGFTSVADLRKVDGIGDARYEQLKELVTVG
jgi:competence protein ComEA